MHVKIKRVREGVEIPKYHSNGAAAFDIATAVDTKFEAGETKLIPTGLVIATPPGHTLYITHRSSTPRRHQLFVYEGVIDPDYSGENDELLLQVKNLGGMRTVESGLRIAQGLILPVERADFEEVDSMEGGNRGGFGSTG